MITQGYPGGPRPVGAHRAVNCHCGMATVARRTLIADVNTKLAECFERAPDGRPWIAHVFEAKPELRDRLKAVLA